MKKMKIGSKEGNGGDSSSQLIDARIKKMSDWRGEMLARIRKLIKQADPEVVEEVKWRKPSKPDGVPVWSHDGIICTGETYKNVVKMTFAKGASRRQVALNQALKNAAGPLVTLVAFQLTLLLGGSFVVERVFAMPGLGSLAVEAITRNDPDPLLGFVVFVVFMVVVINILHDLTHAWIDPRIRGL